MKKLHAVSLLLLFAFFFGMAIPTTEAAETPKTPSPKIVFLVSEDPNNYEATRTIPVFAKMLADRYGCQCEVIQGEGQPGEFRFPGLETLEDADLLVIFFRRRALSTEQLGLIRDYLKAGKPLVGIRTANHAFSVHGDVAKGFEKWWEFVPEVLGCKNRGYGPADKGTNVAIVPEQSKNPILKGIVPQKWHSNGNTYLVAPMLDSNATILLTGSFDDKVEPIAWTRDYHGSRVFYTSLGYPDDFDQAPFEKLLINGIFWAMDRPVPVQK